MSTWNKFCFTGGLVETSVTLPGFNNIVGLWPAVWAMGNLGKSCFLVRCPIFEPTIIRSGRLWCQFGGHSKSSPYFSRFCLISVKWPYTYDACDVGTAPNQTINGQPQNAATSGNLAWGGSLSYLPGQRLSRCTCKGESHPGPVHADGTYVGRAAPEIDVFEAQVSSISYFGT